MRYLDATGRKAAKMELADLKKRIQTHLSDGLVTIVGSGLSAAEGIPDMKSLADHLVAVISLSAKHPSQPLWKTISKALCAGNNLENTLLEHPPDAHLERLIVETTAGFIGAAEATIFEQVFSGSRTLRFALLLDHILKPATGLPVITTNYDRLIELAAESSGLGVDSLFTGLRAGKLDPDKSRLGQCRAVVERRVSGRRRPILQYAPHIRILKPHGSLDWYRGAHGPVACSFHLSLPRMIITPGLNKYRSGYDPPFDAHRDRANREIDNASRYLIIGYGFNDEHLQTHLEPRLHEGKHALLVTRSLSPKAASLIPKAPNLVAISQSATKGTLATTAAGAFEFPDSEMWDVANLVQEVLTP
jgi:hypothetical protein